MYIEDRLFSETSDEVLYSVAMTEEEYDLYSDFLEQREFASKLELMKATLAPGAAKFASKIKSVPPRPKAISAVERFKKNPLKETVVKKATLAPGAAKLAAKKPLNVSPGSSFTYQGGGRTWTSTIS
jgi:hypothetical protein